MCVFTEYKQTRDKLEGLCALIDGASKSFKENILDVVIVPLTRSCEKTLEMKPSTANDNPVEIYGATNMVVNN